MPRGNVDNLINNDDLTPEQRRESASRAGKASGEARRRKREMKKTLESLLEMQATNKNKRAFEKLGYEADKLTNEQALALSLIAKSISGDTRAASLVIDILGERHSDQMKERELELKEQQANDMENEAIARLDGILEGLKRNAVSSDEETE